MLFPEGGVQPVRAHVLARGRRVHEPAVAEIDADVRVLLTLEVEEDEVAAPHASAVDGAGGLALAIRAVRKLDARLAIAKVDEAAAVEAGRCCAAIPIGLADHL